MSRFSVPIVKIGKVGKHPNADTLSITQVEGCPCIFRTGDFQPGDLAIYVPVDALIPQSLGIPWLKYNKDGKHRVKAIRLRGIFSMGILLPISLLRGAEALLAWDPSAPTEADGYLGQDVHDLLQIEKFEEPEPIHMNTGNERDPGYMHVYDMESYRKFKHILSPNEQVVVTEKIHGTNSRYLWRDDRLWVGSHRTIKAQNADNLWWRIAFDYYLDRKLTKYPGIALYGEVYGSVQDLRYGAQQGEVFFAAFDAYDTEEHRWLNWHEFKALCNDLEIPHVPVLYEGPYIPEVIEPLAEGQSTIAGHIREGIVIKPAFERWNNETHRTILKLVSEAYLLRKGGTEHH